MKLRPSVCYCSKFPSVSLLYLTIPLGSYDLTDNEHTFYFANRSRKFIGPALARQQRRPLSAPTSRLEATTAPRLSSLASQTERFPVPVTVDDHSTRGLITPGQRFDSLESQAPRTKRTPYVSGVLCFARVPDLGIGSGRSILLAGRPRSAAPATE
jgi:hypothetical protein